MHGSPWFSRPQKLTKSHRFSAVFGHLALFSDPAKSVEMAKNGQEAMTFRQLFDMHETAFSTCRKCKFLIKICLLANFGRLPTVMKPIFDQNWLKIVIRSRCSATGFMLRARSARDRPPSRRPVRFLFQTKLVPGPKSVLFTRMLQYTFVRPKQVLANYGPRINW